MSKINFMRDLQKAQAKDATGLEAGQTWRTFNGGIVTVTAERSDGNFAIQREFGFENRYVVRPNGTSMNHHTSLHDLKERVDRVYIAGPMSGHADLNFPEFNAAAIDYRRRGCFVINPAEINAGAAETAMVAKMTPVEYQAHWAKCMKKDIAGLITCNMIVMLNGWERSKGASLEHHIAAQLGMTICYPVNTYHDEVLPHPV